MALIYEKKKQIAYLTLNRPQVHNALDSETLVELAAAWEDIRDDKTIKCAIITGAGDKSFCSGADLKKLVPLTTGHRKPETEADERIVENPGLIGKALLTDFKLYKPVIAAINGNAFAGGMLLLCSTDIRIACHEARFGIQGVKWNIFPVGAATLVPMQLSYAQTMELLLTGETISAKRAYEYGFVNRVVTKDGVMEQAVRFAEIVSGNGPDVVSGIKKAVIENIGMSVEEGIENEKKTAEKILNMKFTKEGLTAFKEKRKPEYR